MRTTDKALLVAAAVSAMIHGTTTVAADAPPKDGQNDAQLDEIVVTSNYRGEELQKVGASIGVLRAEELENRGVTEFIDISRNVPSLDGEIFIHPLTSDVFFGSSHGTHVLPPPAGIRAGLAPGTSVYDRTRAFNAR